MYMFKRDRRRERGNEGSRSNPLAYGGATTWGKMLCGDGAVLLVKLSKA